MTHDPQDIEIVAESLIATYGAQIAQLRSKSVAQGAHPGEECSRLFVERLREFVAPLIALLRESKREHHNTLSNYGGWACGVFVTDNRTGKADPCTCGADAWNARVDATIGDVK
jgi:hypothetical protein